MWFCFLYKSPNCRNTSIKHLSFLRGFHSPEPWKVMFWSYILWNKQTYFCENIKKIVQYRDVCFNFIHTRLRNIAFGNIYWIKQTTFCLNSKGKRTKYNRMCSWVENSNVNNLSGDYNIIFLQYSNMAITSCDYCLTGMSGKLHIWPCVTYKFNAVTVSNINPTPDILLRISPTYASVSEATK